MSTTSDYMEGPRKACLAGLARVAGSLPGKAPEINLANNVEHNFRNNFQNDFQNNFRNNFQNNFQNNFNTNLCHFGVILVVILVLSGAPGVWDDTTSLITLDTSCQALRVTKKMNCQSARVSCADRTYYVRGGRQKRDPGLSFWPKSL